MKTYMIALIRAVMNDEKPMRPPKDINWDELYKLTEKHSVTNIVCCAIEALEEKDRPGKNIFDKYKKAKQIVTGREMMQEHEIQGMLDAFEKEGMVCVPLKGWWMKRLYPRPELRSMCDVDVLVDENDMKRIPGVMSSLGFRLTEHGGCHDVYMHSTIVSVELHWDLFVSSSPYYVYFKDIISKCEPVEDKTFIKKMSVEDFYLHILAHAAKHFDGSGTGMRTIIDIWIYNKVYGQEFDKEYLDNNLKKTGLYNFNKIMCELACAWFDSGLSEKERQIHTEVGEYILSAGTYGIKSNSVITNMSAEKSKFIYLLKRVFPNRVFMSTEFPRLKKMPWLLPFCWGVRGYRCLFVRRHKMKHEISVMKNASVQEIDELNKIKKLSGLER